MVTASYAGIKDFKRPLNIWVYPYLKRYFIIPKGQ